MSAGWSRYHDEDAVAQADRLLSGIPKSGITGSIRRLLEANGPGGRSFADIESVCEAAAAGERMRARLVDLHTFLARTPCDSKSQSALAILEEILGYDHE